MDGTIGTNGSSLLLQIEKKNGSIVGKPYKIEITSGSGIIQEATLAMGDDAQLWSEHTPNLYTLRAVIKNGENKEEQCRTFGLREFKANGTRFEINGQPVFLRGTLECCIFPLTGYPAMDNTYWAKIYNQCKAHGLNHVRFHSWCPPEAAFAVADSMGIYLQVECAGWATVGDGGYSDQWFRDESDRILKEYGNHPSFCMMAYGNEPGGANQATYLSGLIDYWKSKDLRRVYTSAGGWPYVENADYWDPMEPRIQRWGEGMNSIINAQQPRTDFDFADIIRKNMPTVSHEVGQWCVYPNFKEIEKYTGVLKAKNFEIFQETLKEHHMADLADDFLFASGRLQTLCYKADIEGALRTPGFAASNYSTCMIFRDKEQPLSAFLIPSGKKNGYVTPEEYSTFCNKISSSRPFPENGLAEQRDIERSPRSGTFRRKPLQAANITWEISNQAGERLHRATS